MIKALQILLTIFQLSVFAQTEDPATQLSNYSEQFIQEKIYAHLDRTDHLTGEILWFKIYAVDATQHKLLDLSKVAYVEIIDKENTPVAQTKIELKEGLGQGSFYLPSTLSTGSYLFRAYTNWMKNLGSTFFFQKEISIINTLKSTDVVGVSQSLDAAPSIDFFPEGGRLVEGVVNRVAFKITDRWGKGVDCKGVLLNSKQDTITRIETLKFGIGRFLLEPKLGEQYKIITYTPSNKIEAKLPPAEIGYSLISDEIDGRINLVLHSPEKYFSATLVVHTRQSIKMVEKKTGKEGTITFQIDSNLLGQGISHITIFDNQNLPVCERLFFKKPSVRILSIKTNQLEYNVRRKATLTLDAGIIGGNYSASIYHADSLKEGSNIASHLLLTSDLIGYIESPEFYLSDDPISKQAADNLMLTHGWRRFRWESLPLKSSPAYLPEARGHLIQGKIVDNAGNPVASKGGFLASPEKKVRVYTSQSNGDGVIRFLIKNIESEGKIIVQTDYMRDSLLHLEIDNPFFAQQSNWHADGVNLNSNMEFGLIDRSVSMQVQDIFSENETYFSFSKPNSDSTAFYGRPDETYLLDDYTRFPVIEEVMREYVKSVWVGKSKNRYRLRVINKTSNELFKKNPLVLLDGVPIFDIDQVMAIDPLKVKRLDVVARKYFIGREEFSGIVSLSTYNGDMAEFKLDPRSITLNYGALQQVREFYSPKYESQTARASRVPDQRNLLYWNPSVTLAPGKATTLDLFTSDVEGKFFIILEGIAEDGTPEYTTQSFIVSR